MTATLEAQDVLRAPGPELLFTLQGTNAMKDYDESLGRYTCCNDAPFSELVVCGLGPSQVPHCTAALSLLPPLEAKPSHAEVGLSVRWSGDDLILERADGKPLDDKKVRLAPALRDSAGRHRIQFP